VDDHIYTGSLIAARPASCPVIVGLCTLEYSAFAGRAQEPGWLVGRAHFESAIAPENCNMVNAADPTRIDRHELGANIAGRRPLSEAADRPSG